MVFTEFIFVGFNKVNLLWWTCIIAEKISDDDRVQKT